MTVCTTQRLSNNPIVQRKKNKTLKEKSTDLGNPSEVLSSASCSNCSLSVATYCNDANI